MERGVFITRFALYGATYTFCWLLLVLLSYVDTKNIFTGSGFHNNLFVLIIYVYYNLLCVYVRIIIKHIYNSENVSIVEKFVLNH